MHGQNGEHGNTAPQLREKRTVDFFRLPLHRLDEQWRPGVSDTHVTTSIVPDMSTPVFAVHHHDAARSDHDVINVRARPRHGQVVQDHVATPTQPVEAPPGTPLPHRTVTPVGGSPPPPQRPADDERQEEPEQ